MAHVHILLVWAGVDGVPLVDKGPRDVLQAVFSWVVKDRAVLVQRMRLYRFLLLLLDLQVL